MTLFQEPEQEELSLVEKAVAEAEQKICLLFSRGEHLRDLTELIISGEQKISMISICRQP